MQFNIETETEIEADGRWIAEVLEVPGAMSYGRTRDEAIQRAESLASMMLHSAPGRGAKRLAGGEARVASGNHRITGMQITFIANAP